MDLRDYRNLITASHVTEAARLTDKNGFGWLFEQTGREVPRFRYIVVDGRRYPTKAFGYLVAQLAGSTTEASNVMTTDEAAAPLRRLGYVEVNGLEVAKSRAQDEAQKQSYYLALARPNQSAFRDLLIDSFSGRCAISGTSVVDALEAAHVKPFCTGGPDTLQNGVLLRADLHRLFDFGYIAIDPASLSVSISDRISGDYDDINNKKIHLPVGGPKAEDFRARWSAFEKAKT